MTEKHPADAVHETLFSRELVLDWMRHPVTKVVVLVIAAELARQFILTHGAKAIGLVDDAAGEV